MSGGSLDYCYSKVEDAAGSLRHSEDAEVAAFGAHLLLVAKALHDVEWWLSCDIGREDCTESLRAVVSPTAVLALVVQRAERAKEELDAALLRASKQWKESPHV